MGLRDWRKSCPSHEVLRKALRAQTDDFDLILVALGDHWWDEYYETCVASALPISEDGFARWALVRWRLTPRPPLILLTGSALLTGVTAPGMFGATGPIMIGTSATMMGHSTGIAWEMTATGLSVPHGGYRFPNIRRVRSRMASVLKRKP